MGTTPICALCTDDPSINNKALTSIQDLEGARDVGEDSLTETSQTTSTVPTHTQSTSIPEKVVPLPSDEEISHTSHTIPDAYDDHEPSAAFAAGDGIRNHQPSADISLPIPLPIPIPVAIFPESSVVREMANVNAALIHLRSEYQSLHSQLESSHPSYSSTETSDYGTISDIDSIDSQDQRNLDPDLPVQNPNYPLHARRSSAFTDDDNLAFPGNGGNALDPPSNKMFIDKEVLSLQEQISSTAVVDGGHYGQEQDRNNHGDNHVNDDDSDDEEDEAKQVISGSTEVTIAASNNTSTSTFASSNSSSVRSNVDPVNDQPNFNSASVSNPGYPMATYPDPGASTVSSQKHMNPLTVDISQIADVTTLLPTDATPFLPALPGDSMDTIPDMKLRDGLRTTTTMTDNFTTQQVLQSTWDETDAMPSHNFDKKGSGDILSISSIPKMNDVDSSNSVDIENVNSNGSPNEEEEEEEDDEDSDDEVKSPHTFITVSPSAETSDDSVIIRSDNPVPEEQHQGDRFEFVQSVFNTPNVPGDGNGNGEINEIMSIQTKSSNMNAHDSYVDSLNLDDIEMTNGNFGGTTNEGMGIMEEEVVNSVSSPDTVHFNASSSPDSASTPIPDEYPFHGDQTTMILNVSVLTTSVTTDNEDSDKATEDDTYNTPSPVIEENENENEIEIEDQNQMKLMKSENDDNGRNNNHHTTNHVIPTDRERREIMNDEPFLSEDNALSDASIVSESFESNKSIETTKSAKSSKSTKTRKSQKTMKKKKSIKKEAKRSKSGTAPRSTKSSKKSKPKKPLKSSKSTKSLKSRKAMKSPKTRKSSKFLKSWKSSESTRSLQQTTSRKSVKSSKSSKSVKASKSSKSIKTRKASKSSKSLKSSKPKPVTTEGRKSTTKLKKSQSKSLRKEKVKETKSNSKRHSKKNMNAKHKKLKSDQNTTNSSRKIKPKRRDSHKKASADDAVKSQREEKKPKAKRVKSKRSLSRATKPPKNLKVTRSKQQKLHSKLLHVDADDLYEDDNGNIDREEFIRYCKDMLDIEKKVAVRLFEDMDVNNDGVVTAKDFSRYKKKHSKPESLKHLFES